MTCQVGLVVKHRRLDQTNQLYVKALSSNCLSQQNVANCRSKVDSRRLTAVNNTAALRSSCERNGFKNKQIATSNKDIRLHLLLLPAMLCLFFLLLLRALPLRWKSPGLIWKCLANRVEKSDNLMSCWLRYTYWLIGSYAEKDIWAGNVIDM